MLSASKHERDGRVILVEFDTFRLLNTYSPNNGWKEEENSFQRRRKWDKRILEFVLKVSDKPLIWCGDLNVRYVTNNNCSFRSIFYSNAESILHLCFFFHCRIFLCLPVIKPSSSFTEAASQISIYSNCSAIHCLRTVLVLTGLELGVAARQVESSL